jgi:hypothetical protein
MCWGRVSGLGEWHFGFLEHILGKQNTIPEVSNRQWDHKSHKGELDTGDGAGNKQAILRYQTQDKRTTRISQGAVSGLGKWQERSRTALGFGE